MNPIPPPVSRHRRGRLPGVARVDSIRIHGLRRPPRPSSPSRHALHLHHIPLGDARAPLLRRALLVAVDGGQRLADIAVAAGGELLLVLGRRRAAARRGRRAGGAVAAVALVAALLRRVGQRRRVQPARRALGLPRLPPRRDEVRPAAAEAAAKQRREVLARQRPQRRQHRAHDAAADLRERPVLGFGVFERHVDRRAEEADPAGADGGCALDWC